MSSEELIAELADICIRQAEIISQAYMLEQLRAQAREEEDLAKRNRLREIVWDLGR